jgi:hypothetical protein
MADEPNQARPTKTSFVYDTRTGKVVHIHQFVPYHPDETCLDSEMEKTALQLAPTHFDRAHLAVLHYDGDKYDDPSIQYRVDLDKSTLVEESALASLGDAVRGDAGSLDPAALQALRR